MFYWKKLKIMKKETIVVYSKVFSGKVLDSIDYVIEVELHSDGVKVNSSEMNFNNEIFPCNNARELIDEFLRGDPRFNENWKEEIDYVIE